MFDTKNIKFAPSHEWIAVNGEEATIGISDHAQESLGDIVYVEFPAIGKELAKKEVLGSIESVKAVSDIYCPLAGEVIAVNNDVKDSPDLLNSEPYARGWLVKIKLAKDATDSLKDLMSHDDYQKHLEK